MNIADSLRDVQARVEAAAARSGRQASEITIVAVTKTVAEQRIMEAYNLGLKIYGENRIQEWQQKKDLIPEDAQWHIIGTIQTNKVKYLNERITLIHSLDRLPLMVKLHEEGVKRNIVWPVLIQVNAARDEAKSGLDIEEVRDFLITARAYPHIRIHGLMTIGAWGVSPNETRGCFRTLRELRDELVRRNAADRSELYHLSMGMSEDYEIAVEEGATFIRIGSVLFGQR